VCPVLPQADTNAVALASIFIHQYDWTAVRNEDIYIINPAAPVPPVNPGAVARSLAKLQNRQYIKVAFFGTSITLGAEAGNWDSSPIYTFRFKFKAGVAQRFGGSVVEINAYGGGGTTTNGVSTISTVAGQSPDLAIIEFGANDVAGPAGGAPNVSATQFTANIRQIVRAMKGANAEVVLVTPYLLHPYYEDENQRLPVYADSMRRVAQQETVGLADVHAEWNNLASRGIPPAYEFHNNHNHPGTRGHQLMADCLLRFFPVASGITGAQGQWPQRSCPPSLLRAGSAKLRDLLLYHMDGRPVTDSTVAQVGMYIAQDRNGTTAWKIILLP
jgi:lysophospholipase L1-like esterase